jgi:FAD-linked sulfhydryl oxidase
LKKPLWDCSNIGDFYDCGCAEDEKDKDKKKGAGGKEEVKKIREDVGEGGLELEKDG